MLLVGCLFIVSHFPTFEFTALLTYSRLSRSLLDTSSDVERSSKLEPLSRNVSSSPSPFRDHELILFVSVRSQPENSEFVNTEMAEIEGNLEYELSLGTATYADCFRGDMKARSLTGILVQMFQQLTGVNFIFCTFVRARFDQD